MAAGKEIKRLRGKNISAADAATFIGVGVDRLRKWEERDVDPSDTGDIAKVETYFGIPLWALKDLKTFDFVENPHAVKDFKDKYIASLEKQNKYLEDQLAVSLAELRHSALLNRAISETTQDLVIQFLAAQRKMTQKQQDDFAVEVGKGNLSKYLKLKEEGSFAYVGK